MDEPEKLLDTARKLTRQLDDLFLLRLRRPHSPDLLAKEHERDECIALYVYHLVQRGKAALDCGNWYVTAPREAWTLTLEANICYRACLKEHRRVVEEMRRLEKEFGDECDIWKAFPEKESMSDDESTAT